VVEYAAAQAAPDGAHPQIPEYYAETEARINEVRAIPLLLWPALALLAIIALIVFLRRRRRLGRVRTGYNSLTPAADLALR